MATGSNDYWYTEYSAEFNVNFSRILRKTNRKTGHNYFSISNINQVKADMWLLIIKERLLFYGSYQIALGSAALSSEDMVIIQLSDDWWLNLN